jgi:hypothetical protein
VQSGLLFDPGRVGFSPGWLRMKQACLILRLRHLYQLTLWLAVVELGV